MSAIDQALLRYISLLVLSILYLPIILYAFRQREGQEGPVSLVILYSLAAMGLGLFEAAWPADVAAPNARLLSRDIETYGALTLAFLILMTTQTFLQRRGWWIWFGLGSLWLLGIATILTNAFDLPEVIWTNGTLIVPRERLGPGWAVLGWLLFTIGAIVTVSNGLREARQALFRNRLNYWVPAFTLMLVSDIMLFTGVGIPGNPLRLPMALIMAYIICTHNLPDLRQIWRRATIYGLTITIIVGLYVAAFLVSERVFPPTNFNPLLVGAVISLVLAVFFPPLLNTVRRLVGIWMKAEQYNTSRTLHEYSQTINNILDMDRLASVVVGIAMDLMGIQRGFLFLVDADHDMIGNRKYLLRSASTPEERLKVSVELDGNGTIASTLVREQRPLLQYDLDLLPSYRSVSPAERKWFSQLQTEVYVPIFAKKQWIGLLAFGSKLSGHPYTEDDLVTMSSVANQTAVALENARLVDNLLRLNNELRQARRALEKNNRDLERIDQAKSDFISIASHELRTPLTVIKGYTEMLLEDARLDDSIKQIMKSVHDGTLRLYEVMDSMFDIAQIDARTLQPHLQWLELSELICEVCNSQVMGIRERQQTLNIELPVLPRIKSDPNLLRKLFHHLLVNAIKFTPNHGSIRITGCTIPSIIDLPDGGLEIVVSDSGVGVDPNFRELIFTKFYQPGELGKHSTSKTRFQGGGAGLGLALAKGIVEAHGGRIWVESPGYDEINFPGSQFHVLLPLIRPDGGEAAQMSPPVKVQI